MLTGDKDVAELVEINEVKSSLLPEQKAEWVSNNILKENGDESIVGFIGDGFPYYLFLRSVLYLNLYKGKYIYLLIIHSFF